MMQNLIFENLLNMFLIIQLVIIIKEILKLYYLEHMKD